MMYWWLLLGVSAVLVYGVLVVLLGVSLCGLWCTGGAAGCVGCVGCVGLWCTGGAVGCVGLPAPSPSQDV